MEEPSKSLFHNSLRSMCALAILDTSAIPCSVAIWKNTISSTFPRVVIEAVSEMSVLSVGKHLWSGFSPISLLMLFGYNAISIHPGYYHECLLQHRLHLCRLITPNKQAQDRKPAAVAGEASTKKQPPATPFQTNVNPTPPSAANHQAGTAPSVNPDATASLAALLLVLAAANTSSTFPSQQQFTSPPTLAPPSNVLVSNTLQAACDTEGEDSGKTNSDTISSA